MTAHKACGILFCYNEELILGECLEHYLREGVDIVFVDNNSTDSSLEVLRRVHEANPGPGRIIEVLDIHTQGFEWKKMLSFACAYMHNRLADYEWIMLIDCDSFYYSPVRGWGLLEFMGKAAGSGYNILDGRLNEFYPTEKDDPQINRALKRLRYCRLDLRPDYPQQKIFRYHRSIDFYTHSGHLCLRKHSRACPVKFIFNHYPYVSYEHALRKIFAERAPRFVERKNSPYTHPQYLGMLAAQEDLIKNSRELDFYEHDLVLINSKRFFWLMRAGFLARLAIGAAALRRMLVSALNNTRERAKEAGALLSYNKRWAKRFARETAQEAAFKLLNLTNYSHPAYRQVTVREILGQKDAVYGLPENFHFLLTNACNAQCYFCNQHPEEQKHQMKLADFKMILANIPDAKRNVYFSGGGEPLLCSDLPEMIGHLNQEYPQSSVRLITNGLLLGRYAGILAKTRIQQMTVSVHGATSESNSALLGLEGMDVFENLRRFNTELKKNRNRVKLIFSCVVSQRNIDEVIPLIKVAADLGVKEVRVIFLRYYPHQRLSWEQKQDSLFFQKAKYNAVMGQAEKISRRQNVLLTRDPLFNCQPKKRPCFAPWQNMVIDWRGDVYPCTGGEVWFHSMVRSGQYDFGNLLREHLSQCWNNQMYVKIRRACSGKDLSLVPECQDCHNSLCFSGPDTQCAHLLRTADAAAGEPDEQGEPE